MKESNGQLYKLSIYFGFHDSSIALADGERVLLHLEAERYFRRKHMRFSSHEEVEELVAAGLEYIGATIDEIEEVYISRWNNMYEGDSRVAILERDFEPILTGHHDNHIGSILPAGRDKMLIVCADGGSEDGLSRIYLKDGDDISEVENLDETILTGRFYGTLAQMIIHPRCSLAHNHYAGKLMGLAGLGEYDDELAELIVEHSDSLNRLHFEGCEHLLEAFSLSGDYQRPWDDKRRCNLAYTGQEIWIDSFIDKIAQHANKADYIALTGGCALNVALNARLAEQGLFRGVYVGPVSNDTGQSLGALLYNNRDLRCEYPYLGRSYGDISQTPSRLYDDLEDRKIIAWYQGASESGPRALGHRSFIGLPDSLDMKRRISEEVKGREAYRPVAPIVADFALDEYFEANQASPYMTYGFRAKARTEQVAPAIVHVDGTARLQSMSEEDNPVLYSILCKLAEEGRPPIIMNTSFNVAGEPIVDTPEDAKRQFEASGADVLYINGVRYEQ